MRITWVLIKVLLEGKNKDKIKKILIKIKKCFLMKIVLVRKTSKVLQMKKIIRQMKISLIKMILLISENL